MSWCSAEKLGQLIFTSRVAVDVSQDERKCADLQFIEVCTTATNSGDALVQLATNSVTPISIRFNAILAVEPFFSLSGWAHGEKFVDKGVVTLQLLQCLPNMLDGTVGTGTEWKFRQALIRCVAQIIALEYPGDRWPAFLEQCVVTASQGDAIAQLIISSLTHNANTNSCLWYFLANDGLRFLLTELEAHTDRLKFVLNTALELMRKRPRATADYETPSAANSLLLSHTMTQFVLAQLQQHVAEAPRRTDGAELSHFMTECDVLLAIAQRICHDSSFADSVYNAGFFFLCSLQSVYTTTVLHREGSAVPDSVLVSLVENALECLLSVLQAFPEVTGSTQVAALMETLAFYMVDGHDTDQDSGHCVRDLLSDLIMSDEVVPLGCGSGTVSALAASVLELFLEAHSDQLYNAVSVLGLVATGGGVKCMPWSAMQDARAGVTALLLRCIARVFEEKGSSLVDSMPMEGLNAFFGSLVAEMRDLQCPYYVILMLDAMSLCFARSQQERGCHLMVASLAEAFRQWVHSAVSDGECVSWVCVYAAGRLLEDVGEPWRIQLLEGEWLQWSLELLATSSSPVAAYCGGATLCSFLKSNPCATADILLCGESLEAVISNLCHQCTTQRVASLVTQLLQCLDIHSAPRGSLCRALIIMVSCVVAVCRGSSRQRSLLLRCLSGFTTDVSKRCIQGIGCLICADEILQLHLSLIIPFATNDGPFDESTTRTLALCVAYGTYSASELRGSTTHVPLLEEGLAAFNSLAVLLSHCRCEMHSCQTLSSVSCSIGVLVAALPDLLDRADLQPVMTDLFSGDLTEGRKGFNYLGGCLVTALLCLHNPNGFTHALIGGAETSGPWGAMLGWCNTLAVFADTFAWGYYLAACYRLIRVISEMPLEVQHAATHSSVQGNSVYSLPSVLVRKLPAPSLADGSVLLSVAMGLAQVKQRGLKATKVRTVDATVCVPLFVEQRYAAITGQSYEETDIPYLMRMTPCDASERLLENMTALGYGELVTSALQIIT